MVYELKPPVQDSPGLLCFTHKERAFFRQPGSPLRNRIRQLKKDYVLCMQWGSYHNNVGNTPFIDFHLACPGTVDWSNDAEIRHIPMCSRDFIPDYFQPMDTPIRWDVLAVGHPIKVKRMSELLDVVRLCYDEDVAINLLMVCAMADDPARLGEKWDHAFFKKYRELFSDAERDRIDLAAFAEVEIDNRPIHPIPNNLFPYIYNAAASFTLFSRQEGQSKVIHEALLTGTPVIVHEDLKGGGKTYLDESNSLQFSNLTEAKEAFVEIAEAPEKYAFDPSYLRPKLVESESGPRLEKAIEAIYDELGYPYQGDLEIEDLAFKLGGHTLTLRPELRRKNTNDLRSRRAFLLYIDELFGNKTTSYERLSTRYADFDAVTQAGRGIKKIDENIPLPIYHWARKSREYLVGKDEK